MCKDYDAVAGINGGYFPMSGATTDKDPYIRINGVTVQHGHTNVSPLFTNAALLINDNIASIRKFTENATNLNEKAAAIPVSQADNVIVCGPMLIANGNLESLDLSRSHNSSSTARTGLGVTVDGKRVLMVVVDYNQGATGVQTPQLAKILQALGAVSAMNFDGGGSSTMFVKDQGDNGRVSINTYNQRAVRSVIYVK
jgi:exopolysaccharide biosynthesis protein